MLANILMKKLGLQFTLILCLFVGAQLHAYKCENSLSPGTIQSIEAFARAYIQGNAKMAQFDFYIHINLLSHILANKFELAQVSGKTDEIYTAVANAMNKLHKGHNVDARSEDYRPERNNQSKKISGTLEKVFNFLIGKNANGVSQSDTVRKSRITSLVEGSLIRSVQSLKDLLRVLEIDGINDIPTYIPRVHSEDPAPHYDNLLAKT